MFVTIKRLALTIPIFASINTYAVGVVSCDDLVIIADELNELHDTFHDIFHDAESFEHENVIETMLNDVSDNLHIVSATKNNNSLLRYTNSMEDSWHNKKPKLFVQAIDAAVDNLDRIIQQECN